jgi:hypothetical protein
VNKPALITAALLWKRGACDREAAAFERLFPKGTLVTLKAATRAFKAGLSLFWFAKTFLPRKLYDEYANQYFALLDEHECKLEVLWDEHESQRAMLWAEYKLQRDALRAERDRKLAALTVTFWDKWEGGRRKLVSRV